MIPEAPIEDRGRKEDLTVKEETLPRSSPRVGRREVLRLGAAGLMGLSSVRQACAECLETRSQTEGPFWVDEKLNRSDVRPDPGTGLLQEGAPLRLSINVSEIQGGSCAPVAGAYVDIWHCNALGAYSDVSGGGNPNNVGQRWLRGYQVSDAHGNVRFLTVYPGWYPGRTVHIHFRIRKFSGANATFNFVSQMYFDDAVSDAIFASTAPYSQHPDRTPATNEQDGIYNPALLVRMARQPDHVLASFDAVINAEVGRRWKRATPTDEDSLEHRYDFGGGSPPLALV